MFSKKKYNDIDSRMLIFKLHPAINNTKNFVSDGGNYTFILTDIEDELKKTKNKLDKPYENKNAYKIFRAFEPFSKVKNSIAYKTKNFNITNAWIKCYELIHQFNLIPKDKQIEITHFANAELPGSFICAIHHYINTMTQCRYRWIASSMLDKDLLEDSYGLYKNFKKRWLMNEDIKGDMSNIDDILTIGKMAYDYNLGNGKGVYLYTSDLGFDVSGDYNNQENLHLKANLGQVLCGLLSLKEGGCMITKQYTYFNQTNVSLIAALTMIFKEVNITKPMSSKEDNSEVYLVCKALEKNKFYASLINILKGILKPVKLTEDFSIISSFKDNHKIPRTFINYKDLSEKFIEAINYSTKVLCQRQIAKININISIYYELEKLPISRGEAEAIIKFDLHRKFILKNFYQNNPLRSIHNKWRLKMYDRYKQKKN